jgi:hypothetical protein
VSAATVGLLTRQNTRSDPLTGWASHTPVSLGVFEMKLVSLTLEMASATWSQGCASLAATAAYPGDVAPRRIAHAKMHKSNQPTRDKKQP